MTYNLTSSSAVSSGLVTSTGSNTARSLANRFNQTINVKDYGAVGDGTTDDTTAITAAITAALTAVINVAYGSMELIYNGTQWNIISQSGSGSII